MGGVVSILTAWATAQPSVTIQGALKGYFLSSDGTLCVYEIPFSFPDRPSSPDLPKRLFPLWAGYYLQAKFSSTEKPIQSVWLLSGTGRLLWRRHYPEGVTEETIPYQEGGWVGVKGQDGLFVRLLVRFADGTETVIRPHFSAHFEKVLPLKVDWLDFIRIAEVAHLLRVKGKEIWEGFGLEGIPFLLEGDEGQWVLINHPKPPKGFVRYEGLLPKVPFKMTVYVGERVEGSEHREEIGGWVGKVNGIWTASLRYFPNWWVLTDCAPPGYTVNREPDAAYRLETIVHEAFHVWWFQKVTEPKTEGREKKAQALVAEMAERECLARALEAEEAKERQRWAKAFLMQRQKRRQLEGANEAEVVFERWQETTEGVATFVSWKAMKAGQEKDYQPLPEMDADDAFYGYQADEGVNPKAIREMGELLWRPHALGLAQIFLLSAWVKGWRDEVMKGKSLEDLLRRAVQGIVVSPELLAEVEQMSGERFKETLERTRGRITEAKPPKPNVTIWLTLPVEVIRLVERLREVFGNPLFGMHFPLPEMAIRVAPPVWVFPDEPQKRVGILWDANKQLMVLHRPDGTVTLQGDGIEVQGKLQVTWDINGVHVHPAEKAQKATKGSASTMLRKKAWYAVVLPVALLAAIASRDTKALQEQETITMEGTITGVFLNAATDQFETVTLPVPSTAEDYYYCDEEEYILHATFTPSWDPSNPTTVDIVVGVSVTYYYDAPPGTPKMVWNFQIIGPIEIPIGGRKYKPAYVTRMCPCVGGTEQRTCLQLLDDAGRVVFCHPVKKVPPPGQLLVKVYLITENEQDPHNPTISPFSDAQVEARIWDKKKREWKLKATVKADANGEALFPELAPGHYQLWGYKGRSIPACPRVTGEVTVVKNQRNITSMYFYMHKGIKGRVMEQTSSGQVPLPGANASLYKGTDQLSGPWESGSDGYFFIPPFPIDGILGQYGSGTYTVKVVPPSRSMMRPEPSEATKDVTLTKCERTKPNDPCPRSLTIDVGTFVFTYKPAYPGPGGQ